MRLIVAALAAVTLTACQAGASVSGAASVSASPAATASAGPDVASGLMTGWQMLKTAEAGVKERGLQGPVIIYRIEGKGVAETGGKPMSELKLGDDTWKAYFYAVGEKKSYSGIPGSGVMLAFAEETDPAKQYKDGFEINPAAIGVDSTKAAQVLMKTRPGGNVWLLSPQEYQAQTGKSNQHPVWGLELTLNTGASVTGYVDAATGIALQ